MSTTFIVGIIGFILCLFLNDTKSNRKLICFIACIFFICQAGLRDYRHSSNDTYNYLKSYELLLPVPFEEVWEDNKLVFQMEDYSARDPGYTIFVKLTQEIYPDFAFFLILVACIISIPLVWLIYRFTPSLKGIIIAFMLYESLFAGFFETGIRQTIAMGIIYSSLPFVIRRKWIPHYALLVIAYFFHSSALIFIPFYILCQFKLSKKFLLLAIILTPIVMYVSKDMIQFVSDDTMFEQYAYTTEDNKGTPIFSVLLFLIAVGTFIYRRAFNEIYITDRMMLVSIILSLVLMPSTWINSNFIRLVFYYLVFIMPVIPKIIEAVTTDENKKNTLYILTGAALTLLTV